MRIGEGIGIVHAEQPSRKLLLASNEMPRHLQNAQRQRHTIHLAVQHNSHGIHKVPIHSHGASEAIHSTCIASSSMSHQECSQQCRSHQQLTCSNACPQVWRSFCLVPMAPWSRLSSDVRIRLSARCHHRCCRRNRCHQRRSCFCTSERQPEPQQPIPA